LKRFDRPADMGSRASFAAAVCTAALLLGFFNAVRAEADGNPEVTAHLKNLRERPSKLYCSCNNIPGRELVFDLAIENRSPASRSVFAFVWATNDEVTPPERALWPVSAVDTCLTDSGELDVSSPEEGVRVDIEPGRSVVLDGNSLLQPIGWMNGRLVGFRQLHLELWNQAGERIFEDVIEVELPGEER
jgi:hypothetical protein